MKHRGKNNENWRKTMKHDEAEREKQWNMMKKREKTMNNDEKEKTKNMKNDEKEKNNEKT